MADALQARFRIARVGASRAPAIYTVVPQGLRAPGGICRMAAYYVQHWQDSGRQPALRVIDSYGPGGKLRMPWHFACAWLHVLADGLRGRIALLHLHMAEDGSLLRKLALLLLGRALGIPVVVHMHGARFAQSWSQLPVPLAAVLARLLSGADLVLVLGRASRQFMLDRLGLPPERVVVLANAVPEPAPQPLRFERQAGCRVLFLGTLCARKGLDVLLQALADPTLAGRDWHLDIAGNGESAVWRALAERHGVAARITWHGWQTPEQTQALLARADLLVLPSRHEALPMAILEAMAHGLPVVATAVGDVADAVADGVNGLLVPAGSPEELTAALARLIAEPALRRRMGRAGRARFAQDFSIGAFTGQLAALLDRAAARRPQGGALRQAAALGCGAAGGQALVMLAAPLLTRLYPAAAFGGFGLFSGAVAAIGAVATLKYEQAILLEPTEARAADALRLCLLLSLATALLTPAAVSLTGAPQLHLLLVWGGPAVLVAGLVNALGAWAVRLGRFRGLGVYQSTRSGFAVVLQLLGGALGGEAGLLVGGQVIGQGLAAAMLAARGGVLAVWRRGWRRAGLAGIVRAHRHLAQFGAPQTLGHLLSVNLPPILLPFCCGGAAAGHFWLAYRILILPSQILVESMRSVLFRRAAALAERPDAARRAMRAGALQLAVLGLPVALALLIAGPMLFATVFGAPWRPAGVDAALLAAPWWLETVAVPSSVLVVVLKLQRAYLGLEMVSLAARAVALLLGARWGGPGLAVGLYAAVAAASSLALMALAGRGATRRALPPTPSGWGPPPGTEAPLAPPSVWRLAGRHQTDGASRGASAPGGGPHPEGVGGSTPRVAPRPSVAFYLHDLSGGGVERMRLALLPRLASAGLHVTLVLHARTGALADSVPGGIELVELGGRSTLRDIAPLARFLRARAPDVLISSLDHNNVAAMLAKQAAGPRTRLVICQHNALSSEARHGGGWRYRLLPLAYRRLGFAADAIVAVSAGVAGDLVRTTGLPAAKLRVIYNPVIDDGFASRMAASAPDPWLDDPTVPVFVAVGRLVDQKDPHTLLCGFAQFRALAPGRLLVLGEGPLRGALEALTGELGIAADVRFLGFRANPLPYIRRAAALLLTSRYEGLGNVLIEALGCGTPVISTDCPYGPAEILDGGAYGTLIPVADPAALAVAMQGDLRARWPAALLRRRAGEFTLTAAANHYLDLLHELCPSVAECAA